MMESLRHLVTQHNCLSASSATSPIEQYCHSLDTRLLSSTSGCTSSLTNTMKSGLTTPIELLCD